MFRAAFVVLCLGLVGCASETEAPTGQEDTSGVGPDTAEQLDDGKADSVELSVRTGVTTLWVDKIVAVGNANGQPVLTIAAHTSRNLASVSSWVPDDAFGEAKVVGPRSFTVTFTGGHEINTMLSDLPIFVDIQTKTGTPSKYTARLRLAARLARMSGSSSIKPSSVINPVYVRDEVNPLRYRGTAATTAPATAFSVLGEESSDPTVTSLSPTSWQFDWSYDNLALSAFPAGDFVTFEATTANGVKQKHAEFDMRVLSLAMTTKDASMVWPTPSCDPKVKSCVKATPGADLGACGSYREVQRCIYATDPDATTFAGDLTGHLVSWYAQHGADVASAGGNTLEQAQAAVSAGLVEEVTDPEGDPNAHDLSTTIVFSHPDVAYPGSDIRWFGAYDRGSGELLEIYDFN
jgi:hypothetical protein